MRGMIEMIKNFGNEFPMFSILVGFDNAEADITMRLGDDIFVDRRVAFDEEVTKELLYGMAKECFEEELKAETRKHETAKRLLKEWLEAEEL